MTPHDLARAYVAALGTAEEAAAREALSKGTSSVFHGSAQYAASTWWLLPGGDYTTVERQALTAWRRAVRRSTGGPAGAPVKPRVWVSVLVTEATAERLRKRGEGTVTVYGVKP